jgi:uncharacterized protein (TIGR02145 family)
MKQAFLLLLLIAGSTIYAQGTFTDPRDGKVYKTVTINGKEWMAENFSYLVQGSYCYDNKPQNCDKYGRLYTWDAALKAVPAGWHIPARSEYIDMLKSIGRMDRRGWFDKTTTDVLINGDFKALMAGTRNAEGIYENLNKECLFWTSSDHDKNDAWNIYINPDNAYANYTDRPWALSIRLVKD